jgi:exonuclease SbcC
MRLLGLRIHRLPGVDPGFELAELPQGVIVLTGPNAAGKSSVLRAVRALLYESECRGQGVFVEGSFDDAGTTLLATRMGDRITWRREGVDVEPPPLPEARFLSCYAVRLEDLAGADGTDREIGARVARELSGGYDLEAVRRSEAFEVPPKIGQTECKALKNAGDALRLAQNRSSELYRQERELEALRRRKAAAEAAGLEAEALRAALELLEVSRQQQEIRVRIGSLPGGLELLRGDELERLAKLRNASRELASSLEATRGRLEAAEGELIRTGLAESDLDDGSVRGVRASLNRLQRLEPEAARFRREQREAELELKDAARQLGANVEGEAGLPDDIQLDPKTLRAVEQGLARKRELEARARQLESELTSLPAAADPGPGPEALGSARRELLAWLSSARGASWSGWRWLGLLLLLLSFGVASVGSVLADGALAWLPAPVASGPFGFLAIALLFLLGLILLVRAPLAVGRAHREAFLRTGVAEPKAWREAEVLAGLDLVGQEIAAAERQERYAERRDGLARGLEAVRKELEAEREPLARLAEAVGFDPEQLDSSFERWLSLLHGHDRARRARGDAEAALLLAEEEMAGIRRSLSTFLDGHGEVPHLAEPDSGVLAAHLDNLERRLQARETARREIDEAGREVRRLERQADGQRSAVREFFEELGLPAVNESEAEHELRWRLECLSEWRSLDGDLRDLAVTERIHRERLLGRDGLLELVALDEERELRAQLAVKEETANQRDALAERITATLTLIEKAESERALERARGKRQSAEDGLRKRYEEALFAEAGTFLLETVERDHVAASRPETLRRAEEWLALFTRHRYELRFDPASSTFSAWETATGERRALDELSTGSKAQLLLAVRIAFALRAEQGRRSLPLFLDEALTTADPERFRAVASSLRLLAEAGRQVFYLTARVDDAGFWHEEGSPPPAVIDISRVRGTAAAVVEPSSLELPRRAPLPSPRATTAEEYAVRLGVPPIDPWEEADSIHVFHVLRDDLELLHGLLEAGVERLGTLRAFLRSHAAALLLASDEQRLLELRCLAAEAWLQAWRVGRGRPVDRRALEESGAITPTFIDRVDALAGEVEGDAAALLERLAGGAVERFRESNREQLAEWLLEQGYLDERERLPAEALRNRVSSALARPAEAGAGAEVLELAARLCDYLEVGWRASARGMVG